MLSPLLLIAALAGPTAGADSPPADRLRVALYAGAGAGSTERFAAVLAESPGVLVERTDGAAIRAGGLAGFDAVVFPGGTGSGQARALRESGRGAVREFVSRGGGYLGVCAGAYLASADYDWSLHVLDAKVLDRKHWARGKGRVDLAVTPAGAERLGVAGPVESVYYGQGPLLAPAGDPGLPDYVEWASFLTEVTKPGVPGGVMPGTCAVAAGTYGRGRVVAVSPHPETHPEHRELTRRALRWAAGQPEEASPNAVPAGRVAGELVRVEPGELPVVLSAPHGGRAVIPGVPRRRGKGVERFVTVRDVATDRLADLVAEALERRTGRRPSLVVARFDRRYADANRPLAGPDRGVEDPDARPAHARYHAAAAELREALAARGGGLVIDLHGQAAAKDTVFLGTRNGVTAAPGVRAALAAALDGGVPAVEPAGGGREDRRFTGGYVVAEHGRPDDGVHAVQLEVGRALRSADRIGETADAIAAAVEATLAALPAATPEPPPGP